MSKCFGKHHTNTNLTHINTHNSHSHANTQTHTHTHTHISSGSVRCTSGRLFLIWSSHSHIWLLTIRSVRRGLFFNFFVRLWTKKLTEKMAKRKIKMNKCKCDRSIARKYRVTERSERERERRHVKEWPIEQGTVDVPTVQREPLQKIKIPWAFAHDASQAICVRVCGVCVCVRVWVCALECVSICATTCVDI